MSCSIFECPLVMKLFFYSFKYYSNLQYDILFKNILTDM